MTYRVVKALLLACGSAGALLAGMAGANAGGFAVREQSAWAQGSSYAGVAAGGDLSSMFWNPATMTQVPGIQSEISGTLILPYASNTPGVGSLLGAFGGTGNTADNAVVPSSYMSWQLNPNLWLGMSFNAPFGLTVGFPRIWAGRDYAAGDTSLKTYNATPSFAYRINDWISVGAGVQIEYAQASLSRGITLPGPTFVDSNLSGDGWGFGLTAGVTLTPTPYTSIGLGYRSGLNQKIDGSLTLNGPLAPFTNPNVSTTLRLPDTVSLGLRQRLTEQWTLLGTIEWTNWSRIGTSNVNTTVAGTPVALPFNYKDGWLFSAGAEYQWTEKLAVRGGLGYEKSPITDNVRIPLLPDNDRFWLSVGASYRLSTALSADFAYSHLFVRNTSVNVVAGNPWFDGVPYVGSVDSHIDIVSLAIKYRWDDAAAAPKKMLYTK